MGECDIFTSQTAGPYYRAVRTKENLLFSPLFPPVNPPIRPRAMTTNEPRLGIWLVGAETVAAPHHLGS